MPIALLSQLEVLGVRLSAEDGHILYDAPQGVMEPRLIEEVRRRKQELLAVLERRQQAQALWDATLRDFSPHWDRARATRGESPPLPDDIEAPLEQDVAAALRAGDVERTRVATACWRAAWVEHLGLPSDQPDTDDQLDCRYVEIASETLGEHIVVALHEHAVEGARLAHPDLVVYSPDEVEHLHSEGASEEMLRAAHLAKKELGATVIDPDLVDLEPCPNDSVHTMLQKATTRFDSRTQNIVT